MEEFAILVTAAATAAVAVLTWVLVNQNRIVRDAQEEPHIVIYTSPDERDINFINMTVENIGEGPAFNVRPKMVPGSAIRNISSFWEGENIHFSIIPSRKSVTFFLCSTAYEGVFEDFDFITKYKDTKRRDLQSKSHISLSGLKNASSIGKPPIVEIAASIDKIAKILDQWNDSGRLKVETLSQEDRKSWDALILSNARLQHQLIQKSIAKEEST